MIGYVTIGTNDLPRAMKFYDELLAPLGIARIMDFGRGYAWGLTMDQPALAVMIPFDQQAAGRRLTRATSARLRWAAPTKALPAHAARASTPRTSATWTATSSTSSSWADPWPTR